MQDIKKLDHLCNNNISTFINYFQLNLRDRNDKFVGCCPVHGGDNCTAFNYYKSGHWKCRTHQCHEKYLGTPIGLIRGLISRENEGAVSFKQTIDFICRALDTDFQDLPEIEIPEVKFQKREVSDLLELSVLQKRLMIPCPYFSKRFDKKIVAEQNIGLCNTPKKFFYKRSVVPILARNFHQIIACQGRSIYDKCKKCNSYHNPQHICPDYFFPKWKTSKHFATDMHMYNYWSARDNIGKSQVLFITESVGNVLRFMEFGIYNITAVFGTQFSEFHQEMCINSEASKIIYIQDGGTAGHEAAVRIQQKLGPICIAPNFGLGENEDPASIDKNRFDKDILGGIIQYL